MVTQDIKKGEVVFVCTLNPAAKKVSLVGDFNQWDPDAKRMVKVPKDGSFRARLALPPGRYEYKFVVDGAWFNDPDAMEQVCNPFGTCNSVVAVTPPACCCDCECE